MPRKNLLIVLLIIFLLVSGALIVDLVRSSQQPSLASAIDQAHSAVAVDMDLDDTLVDTQDILAGKDPVLVLVNRNSNEQNQPTIRVVRTLAELKALQIHQGNTITQFDAVYKILALAFLPPQKTLGDLFSSPSAFFAKPDPSIRIVPLRTAGIRAILFDEEWNWVKETDVELPNFKETIIFAIMADNSKRPIAELTIPYSAIRDFQDPLKANFMP